MVERVGIDKIKEHYDMFDNAPYYAVFDCAPANQFAKGKPGNLLFTFKGDDREKKGWQQLEENLQAGEINNPGVGYIIRFYELLGKNNSITSETPYSGCFKAYISKSEYSVARTGAAGTGSPDLINQLFQARLDLIDQKYEQQLADQQRAHELELDELQEEMEDRPSTDQAVGQVYQWGDTIGSLGEKYPWLRENITRLFTTVNDFLVIGKHKMHRDFGGGQQQKASSMGNVATDAKPEVRINTAIQKLLTWYTLQEGDLADQSARARGAEQCAADFEMLAGLTDDNEMMHVALKKLRALA